MRDRGFETGTAAAPLGRWRRGVIRLQRGRQTVNGPLVMKLGGSLLQLSGWPSLVRELVDSPGQRAITIVVGGGPVVDGLRAADAAASLPGEDWNGLLHGLAIDGMRLTARLVAGAVGLPLAEEPPAEARGGPVVLDAPAWLSHGDRLGSLPAGWQVTSDSIAALVAAVVGCELMLAKRVPPPPCPADGRLLESLSAAGWVDDHFPVAAAGLPAISWAAPEGAFYTAPTRASRGLDIPDR